MTYSLCRIWIVPLLFMSLILIANIAHAEEGSYWCTADWQPTISVKTQTDNITYDFSKSEKDLDKFSITTVSPYAESVITDVGGLMRGGIQTRQSLSFMTKTNPYSQEVCYIQDKVEIILHIQPTIYIAREFPKGTCMHNAIMQHEQKHITADREIVNKYAKLIGQAFYKDMSQYRTWGPYHVSLKEKMEKDLKARMQSILKVYSDQMSAERKAVQQGIDNYQEYERVNHSCPNEKRKTN